MGQGMADGRRLFAVSAELWPQLDDWGVVVEHTALGEDMRHGRGHTLACRGAEKRRIRSHRAASLRVGETCDGVYDQLSLLVDRNLNSGLDARLYQMINGFLDLLLRITQD